MVDLIYGAMRNLFNPRIIGVFIIVVPVAMLVLIDDVSQSRWAATLVTIFGPLGALWVFRLFCLLFIGLALWAIWSDVRSQKRIDRIAAQQEMLDRSIHREE